MILLLHDIRIDKLASDFSSFFFHQHDGKILLLIYPSHRHCVTIVPQPCTPQPILFWLRYSTAQIAKVPLCDFQRSSSILLGGWLFSHSSPCPLLPKFEGLAYFIDFIHTSGLHCNLSTHLSSPKNTFHFSLLSWIKGLKFCLPHLLSSGLKQTQAKDRHHLPFPSARQPVATVAMVETCIWMQNNGIPDITAPFVDMRSSRDAQHVTFLLLYFPAGLQPHQLNFCLSQLLTTSTGKLPREKSGSPLYNWHLDLKSDLAREAFPGVQ